MSRGVNKVILIGHLGADPEVRYIPGGTAVATVSIATTEQYNDRNGNKQERTDWHLLEFWAGLADIVAKYLRKGSQVYIEGRLRHEQYQGRDNQTKYKTFIKVDEMQMLGGRSTNTRTEDHPHGAPPHTSQGARDYADATGGSAPRPSSVGNDFDDDVPF